jgi:acetyltransferase-like isoleucine patch superfamily enzyme
MVDRAVGQSWVERVITGYKRLRAKLYTVVLSRCFYAIGRRTNISPPLRFANLSLIQLGNGVTIHSNCWIHALRGDADAPAAKVILRDNVCIGMDATISAAKKIEIGENVFTARNVYISDHGHEFHDVTLPTACQGIGHVSEVSIGADTWIGQNAVILPGVKIGRHCVIGANSVVNIDIPDYCVAAGVPARVVRTYNAVSNTWDRVGG